MRAAAALIAIAGAGCDALLHLDDIHPPAPIVAYRKSLAIASSAPLADVPVSIALDGDLDLAMHAQPGGSDVQFVDETDNPLPYEIVSYAGGTLDAWVRVPALTPGNTTIYVRYGAPAPLQDPTLAWPDLYVGVWHQSGGNSTSKDSTRHGHDLVAQGATPGTAPGIVGDARSFDGQTMQPLCAGDTDGSLEFDPNSSFAYSAWVYVNQTPTNSNIPFHKGGSAPTTAGYDMELGSLAWHAYLADGAADQMVQPASQQQLDRWANVLIVVDRSTAIVSAYLDGSLAGTASFKLGSLAGSEPMCLGAEGDGAQPFGGLIDEARVLRGAPSSERIRFEHANLAARDQVITVGAEETVP